MGVQFGEVVASNCLKKDW